MAGQLHLLILLRQQEFGAEESSDEIELGAQEMAEARKPWITMSSEIVHKDEWVHLRADSCETAQGVIVEPYYVLEYNDWVHVIPVRERKEVLMVHQYRQGLGAFTWEFPGGRMEDTDSDPVEAAKREFLEETGYQSDAWERVCAINPNPSTHNNKARCFLVENPERVAEPNLDAAEDIVQQWFSFEEVMALIRTEKFENGYQIGSFFLALQQLGVFRL